MQEPLIMADPDRMLGKPLIRGTRITIELILRKIAAGQSIDQILNDYPHLTCEGVVAALEYAAESVRFDHLYPLPTDPKMETQS